MTGLEYRREMPYKFKDIPGSRREFTFEVTAEEVRKRLDSACDEVGKEVAVPGFRKGKAPREIIDKHHGGEVRERAIRDVVNDSYWHALEESGTSPVGLPVISGLEFSEGKSASYKATVDIRPEVHLRDYGSIKVARKRAAVTEEDVDSYISSLRESYAEYKTVEGRPAAAGDYVVCDVACLVDGKPLHEEKKNVWFLMDKKQSLPELVDGLTGSAKDDSKEIKAMLPEDNTDPASSKKEALFRIKVNLIKEKELPALDDEFIKTIGGPFKTIAEFREAVKKDLQHKKDNDSMAETWNRILDEFLKEARFEPPLGLVEEEAENLAGDAREKMRSNSIKDADIEKRIGEIGATLREEAARRVRLYFILDEIAHRENITATDEDLERMLELMARQYNASTGDIRKHYNEKNLLGYLRNQIKENKIKEFLFTKVGITEEQQEAII
jgi:trigger factor